MSEMTVTALSKVVRRGIPVIGRSDASYKLVLGVRVY